MLAGNKGQFKPTKLIRGACNYNSMLKSIKYMDTPNALNVSNID